MKSFVISVIIAVCIIGGSLMYSFYLNDLSYELNILNNEITELILTENYASASEKISLLSEFAERKKPFLASTTDHNNIDNIEKTVSELKIYTEEKHKADALAKCELLKILFEHLPKNYSLRFENIL